MTLTTRMPRKPDPLASCMYERERLRRRKRTIDLCTIAAVLTIFWFVVLEPFLAYVMATRGMK